VATLAELLERVTPDLEREVRSRLQGFLGGFIRAFLPQVWVFETESETATLRVEPSGAVTVAPGSVPSPDVSVSAPRARLEAMLTSRERPGSAPSDVSVLLHTARGRAAFDQVRGRFGL
jgi:hypothetical protein